MAGDQSSPWAQRGAAFPHPAPQLLPHCHSAKPFHSSPLISGDGPAFLPPWAAAPDPSFPGDLPLELPTEPLYDLQKITGGGQGFYPRGLGDFHPPELGVIPSSSSSAPYNGHMAISSFGPSAALPPDAPFGGGTLPSEPAAGRFGNPLLSSSAGGAADFSLSGFQEFPRYSSAVPFGSTPAISSNGPTAPPPAPSGFCPTSGQELPYYSAGERLINNPPAISGNGPTGPATAAVGASQAEPSEMKNIDLSLIWTPEEQRQLIELCKMYGHIECPVSRLAKIARPFPGKTMRDVALRIRWMEEKRNQRTKAVNSSRLHRGMKVTVRSRDHLHLSSQPGVPY
ncbi:atrophin-1-like isoform X2 [Punica granatum]|uniref:Myb-like domain-containing protein n=2 Tax=Punica granatum TaxID=22663 RepID=A0A218VQT8_PUNGR|nr:atrophin-1-like isoform X2 [Punica granatum]OWM62706.1 hypothetical protein CDL15_Pgr020000 [Punica granatum]PKI63296.1 hypothetical protein CRG98_016287 [Punica granatum]